MAKITLVKNLDITAKLNKFYSPKTLKLKQASVTCDIDLPDEMVKELDKYNIVLADFHEMVADWFGSRANLAEFVQDWTSSDEVNRPGFVGG